MKVLVTGGQGFIGSHTCKDLTVSGHDVISVDWCRGNRGPFPVHHYAKHYKFDVKQVGELGRLFKEYNIDAVVHFAAYASVAESMAWPGKYYENNIGVTRALLDCMVENDVKKLVFSSSSSVYGNSSELPVNELTATTPISPYGHSKLVCEQMIKFYSQVYDMQTVSLRYFNAAGCDPGGELGERHEPETHLIPLILRNAMAGEPVRVFGDDYPTEDGTCIRDYTHVSDLALAHTLSLDYIEDKDTPMAETFCLGRGEGASIKEIIRAVKKVTKLKVKVDKNPRRPGDPAAVWASNDAAKKYLGWEPEYDLEDMIEHTWNWLKGEQI
jgi:UDP-glucose 4-epimerase